MLNFATTIFLLICAATFYGLGRRILQWCRQTSDNPIEDWVFSSTIGAIAIANITMLIGFAHLLYPFAFRVILLIALLPNIGLVFAFCKRIFNRDSFSGWLGFRVWEKLLIVLMGFYLLVRLFNTYAPPFTWDATTHHYLVPAMYLKAHCIYDLLHVVFSYYPSLVEMLYLFGMGIMNDLLAGHIGWFFGLLTVFAVYAFGAKFMSARIGLIAAAILLSLQGIGVQMDGGYVDLPQALFCLLCLHKLIEWRKSSKIRDFILAAIFFSASLATKHLGFAFLFPALAFIVYVLVREHRRGWVSPLKYVIGFLLIALILPFPWYLRALILKSNPFFPFPVFGFPTLLYPPLELSTWVNPGFKKSLLTLITYIHYLTTDLRLDEALGKRFTPYFLGMLPFFWVVFRKNAYVPKLLFLICLYFMGFVFYSAPVKTRYMLFFLPFMSLLAADILDTLLLIPKSKLVFREQLRKPFTGRMAISLITVVMIFIPLLTTTFGTISYIRAHTENVIIGKWDKNRYLLRESPRNWGAIMWINSNLPEDVKILAVETRLYGLERDWITWLGLEDEPIPTTPEDNVRLWSEYDFTHLWIGDGTTVKTLMYYNIYNLPGDDDEVVFILTDLWIDFMGRPMSNSVVSDHFRRYWLPRELKIEDYEWYEDGERMTDDSGHYLYRAKRSEIASDPRKIAQIDFVDSIRELERTGGLHIVYPPPDGSSGEELTFILECDYDTYKQIHEDVVRLGG